MIEAGKHRAKAREWAIGAAATGTRQVGISFDLLDLPGQTITWYGFLTDAALPITVKAMRACGWQGCDLEDLSGLDANEVVLVVEHEQYEGQTRARVVFINSMGVAMSSPLAGDDLRAFAASMKGKILGLDPNGAAKRAAGAKPPARRPEPPPPTDADCPPF